MMIPNKLVNILAVLLVGYLLVQNLRESDIGHINQEVSLAALKLAQEKSNKKELTWLERKALGYLGIQKTTSNEDTATPSSSEQLKAKADVDKGGAAKGEEKIVDNQAEGVPQEVQLCKSGQVLKLWLWWL